MNEFTPAQMEASEKISDLMKEHFLAGVVVLMAEVNSVEYESDTAVTVIHNHGYFHTQGGLIQLLVKKHNDGM